MTHLIRRQGLFYLAHAVTFFLLNAYSLAAGAPNYPYLPAFLLTTYLTAAAAFAERETGDPLLDILPITEGEIVKVKFGLAFAYVSVAWLTMMMFTALQGLSETMTSNVMKLNTLSAAYNLLLAAALQLGVHFFGRLAFQKVITLLSFASGAFGIVFFIGLAERGVDHPADFPLVPFLESTSGLVVALAAIAAVVVYYVALRHGPWNTGRSYVDRTA